MYVSLAGAGHVGSSVIRILRENSDSISVNCGRQIDICSIAVRDLDAAKKRLPSEYSSLITDSSIKSAQHEKADVFIELMGGDINQCKLSIDAALSCGKSVVTANKALLSEFGDEIFDLAYKCNKDVLFEAAICGCIPIVKTLRESLSGDSVIEVVGIMNGTCNYIMTKMSEKSMSFSDALSEAQKHGYSESDPSLDIDGVDVAHKISLIARLAFGDDIKIKDFLVRGIRDFDLSVFDYANKFGFTIKLLARVKLIDNAISISVEPTLIPINHPLASVSGTMNAVSILSKYSGETMYYGAGAGGDATAVSVVSDLMDIARQKTAPRFNIASNKHDLVSCDNFSSSFFLKFKVCDKPSVLHDITCAFADDDISIKAIIHNKSPDGKEHDIVILLHENKRSKVFSALDKINKKVSVLSDTIILPIKNFSD